MRLAITVHATIEVQKGERRARAALTASSAGGGAACGGAGGAAAAALPANPQGGQTPLTGVQRGEVLTPLPGASRSGCGGVAAAARNGISCYCAARGRLEPNQSIMIRLYRRQRFPEVQTSYDLTSPPLRFVRPGAGLILGGGNAVTSAEWLALLFCRRSPWRGAISRGTNPFRPSRPPHAGATAPRAPHCRGKRA